MKKEKIFSIETLRQLAASEGSQREILSCLLDVWADQIGRASCRERV